MAVSIQAGNANPRSVARFCPSRATRSVGVVGGCVVSRNEFRPLCAAPNGDELSLETGRLHSDVQAHCDLGTRVLLGYSMGATNAKCVECSRSEEHTSELQSPYDLVCRLLLEKKNIMRTNIT